ncbi:hypothetical protein NX059_004229 [Plenodomus lindquistii]|nr:hypothetical protein NX059_004229 [Plenodomus lindquistii]
MTIILQELSKADSLHGTSTRQTCERTAMIRAAQCWHPEAVDLLLKYVAGFPDPSAIDDETGNTHSRHLTSPVLRFDLDRVLSLLLSKERRVDEGPRIDDNTGEYHPSPLIIALAYIKDIDTIKAMVDAGARINITDQTLRTPLHLAQTREIADYPCTLGANI